MTDAVAALVAVLDQLAGFVGSLTDDQYTREPGPGLSSIGGHVRHNLDHVAALLAGVRSRRLDYDHRDRTSAVGHDRAVALETAIRLREELLAVRWGAVPGLLRLTALPAPDASPVTADTTPQRELLFVASHTVHHNALIAVLAWLVGAEPPAGFGYAPSTVAHLRSRPCVR